jgi:multiple sugar transport system ATP-binding protein
VAIGRAIVKEPKAFLFDEPLSNLDAALRVQMRLEIARLQKGLATTTVYVTHDQVEAMTMADRFVVLNAGRIEQTGTPLELYERPDNLFVAGFIGSPRMNFLAGDYAAAHGAATVGVRPEHVAVSRDGAGIKGVVGAAEHLGSDTLLYVDLPGRESVTVRTLGDVAYAVGDAIALRPDPARIHRFDTNGKAIRS